MNLKELRELIELVRATEVSELEIERSGVRVRIRRDLLPSPSSAQPSEPGGGNSPMVSRSTEPGVRPVVERGRSDVPGLVTITSPIVGTFYRSPAPDADAYVEIGDTVKKGQILCIVEAMKLLNEIESETDGKVVEILVESARTVEYGEPLFRIEPLGG
jgi:acetyl-CoA carboxylase biotin carboxyl carrier protein